MSNLKKIHKFYKEVVEEDKLVYTWNRKECGQMVQLWKTCAMNVVSPKKVLKPGKAGVFAGS